MPEDETLLASWRSAWQLRPGTTYLNHGSFGPSPLPVLLAREEATRALESQPMDFFMRQLEPRLAEVRARLGQFVGCNAEDLALVDNATWGMNMVAESFPLRAGDEALLNNHEYGAVQRIWERACRRTSATLKVAEIPLPLTSPDQIVSRIAERITPRTRIVVVSHITSPTAIVFPVAEICRVARERGAAVCIDGPHAIAMRDVTLAALDCDFYAASCHKWLCAPFGSGFLYVHPRWQSAMRPVVMSWGRTPKGEQPSWRDEFWWLGTRDGAAWLAIPSAIDFMESLPLAEFRRVTHDLASSFRSQMAERTGLAPLTADGPEWFGSMVAAPLPPGDAQSLQDELWRRRQIECPIVDFHGQRLARISCQAYNSADQVNLLVQSLLELLAH